MSTSSLLRAILSEALASLSLPPALVDRLTVVGEESLPSCFPVTDLAAAAIGAAGLAVSDLLGADGPARPVTVDRHLASAWFLSSLRPLGWDIPASWDRIAGDYRAADGWIRLHTNAPHHREAALAALGCAGDREAVAAAVSRLSADDLETDVLRAGGCAATMRDMPAWQAHPQGQAVRAEPLIALEERAAPPFSWRPNPARPLTGIRVLDLTRILAGPVGTRFLAGLGAEVLRIDPPGWEEPSLAPDVTPGKRCARLDLHSAENRQRFEALLANAHILVHGYRPGALDVLGLGAAERRQINPGLIDVSLCAYGWTGPWAGRRGFDSLVQMSSGIAAAGMAWKGADRPVPLPAQALDHATGYLIAAAALRGLAVRLQGGRALTARLSLARTAYTLSEAAGLPQNLDFTGQRDEDFASETEETAWGPARRLRSPLIVNGAPLHWDCPASKLGSAEASWDKRTRTAN